MSTDPRSKDAPPAERDRDEQGRTTMVAQSCLDFLMIEMVPMAQRTSNNLYRRDLRLSNQLQSDAPLTHTTSNNSESGSPVSTRRPHLGSTKRSKDQPKPQHLDEDELRDATYTRLESIGYRVGLGVVESLSAQAPLMYHPTPAPTPTLSQPTPPPQAATLDIIKFLCKDLWQTLFRKQIDNLKTNHRGTFVLTDNLFGPLKRCSLPSTTSAATANAASPTANGMNTDILASAKSGKLSQKVQQKEEDIDALPPGSTLYKGTGVEEATKQAQAFLAYPVGVVRGALAGLGVEAEVRAEVAGGTGLPSVVVTVKTGTGIGQR